MYANPFTGKMCSFVKVSFLYACLAGLGAITEQGLNSKKFKDYLWCNERFTVRCSYVEVTDRLKSRENPRGAENKSSRRNFEPDLRMDKDIRYLISSKNPLLPTSENSKLIRCVLTKSIELFVAPRTPPKHSQEL